MSRRYPILKADYLRTLERAGIHSRAESLEGRQRALDRARSILQRRRKHKPKPKPPPPRQHKPTPKPSPPRKRDRKAKPSPKPKRKPAKSWADFLDNETWFDAPDAREEGS